ncbi:C2H2-like zinc finger protein [Actinidia rufa]|uniref:C2H2-like zinc finger protein n=1 Tax=Actinidia rufa TaxID=165716 RepID=A0A7J0F5M7_9ERIC|nr:C2H2-like zinc finger protein [Actinidia rufa]
MPTELENSSTASGEASVSSSGNQIVPPPAKKKRNLPGMPDPDSEVIALSPKRDSFITHRAFCDALAKESVKAQTVVASSPPPSPPPPLQTALSPAREMLTSVLPIQSADLPENPNPNPNRIIDDAPVTTGLTGSCSNTSSIGSTSSSVFASLFASTTAPPSLQPQEPGFTSLIRAMAPPPPPELRPPPPQPAMSATALLQKAAQMGAAATNASLLRGFGLVSSTSSASEWDRRQIEQESGSLAAGLGLGIPCDGGSGLKELMMGTPSVFGPKQTTLDLLGLGMAVGGGPNSGLSALMTSIGGGLDVATAAASLGGGEFTGKDMGRNS